MLRLSGKLCVVTGAGRGLGAAIARRFAEEGGQIVVTDRDGEAAEIVAQTVGGVAHPLDVAEEADWRRLADLHPAIDVLINNAGVTGFGQDDRLHDPEHATLTDWRAVHRVNLDGVFLGCRYAIGSMRKSGAGAIVNIASRAGSIAGPAAAAYASSKAAVINHTRSVALYCAQQGLAIRCNAVSPGAIMTPMWDRMLGEGPNREAVAAAIAADTPMRRFGTA
ncbi:MAG: SDR family NAD(P)-dependent oxidoreductase, partial [Pseudomonadota bacterium]